MIKLIAFDLDGTLAEIGEAMPEEAVRLLQEIENRGIRIAVCSGKPTYYLCGFMRQVGLKKPILVGENGAVIQFGIDLPPRDFYILPYSDEAKKTISFFHGEILKRIPDVWYQPNLVELTPFLKREEDFAVVEACIEECAEHFRDVNVYRFVDCFDFVPKGITKRKGLEYLGELLLVRPEETVAVGDGSNDLPMFEYAGYSVGVGEKVKDHVDRCFENTTEMLKFLLKEM
ncbi:MAG: HAD family phosphatase [Ruminococcus sp.]|nr:HAD family phosphatase [Ruminococcus sp.]